MSGGLIFVQAVAVVGMGVLLFSHFPPAGSELIDDTPEDACTDTNEQNGGTSREENGHTR